MILIDCGGRRDAREAKVPAISWRCAPVERGILVGIDPMADQDSETDILTLLNTQFGEMEQRRDDEAVQFFHRHLSERLVFHRANGSVVGKSAFLEGLLGPDSFSGRTSEDVKIQVLGDRAVASLIVVATRRDDGSTHRYRNIRFFTREGGVWCVDSWYNLNMGAE